MANCESEMKNVMITILLVFFAAGGLTAEKSPAKVGQDEIILPTIKIEKSDSQSDSAESLLVQGSVSAEAKRSGSEISIKPVATPPIPLHAASDVD